ncbi:MAG: helix-turn-helix domain-containing protein, partial [Patescibacteria group bacterium]
MYSIPATSKIALVKRTLAGEKVAQLCREAGIARKTFYVWIKKYQLGSVHLSHVRLSDRRKRKILEFK